MELEATDAAPADGTTSTAAASGASTASEPELGAVEAPTFTTRADRSELLEAHLDELRTTVRDARDSLRASVNIPVAGIGRVLDCFGNLAHGVAESVRHYQQSVVAEATSVLESQKSWYESELATMRAGRLASLEHQRVELVSSMESKHTTAIATLRAELQADADVKLGEARQREAEAREQLTRLVASHDGSAEEKLNAQLIATQKRLAAQETATKKAQEALARLDETRKHERIAWDDALSRRLDNCVSAPAVKQRCLLRRAQSALEDAC